jgi:Tol biopolymer transport system component
MTPDETTGFFWSTRAGGPGTTNLYTATRADRNAAFTSITLLSGVNVAGNQYDPSVTADALTLAFGSDRASSDGTFDLFLATRSTVGDDFANVTALSALNTSSDDQQPFLLPDGSALYFSSNRNGDSDIYRARASGNGNGNGFGNGNGNGGWNGGGNGGGNGNSAFDFASAVTELNVAGVADEHPAVSADELTIFFSSTRAGGLGNIDVWTATRARASDSFGTPTNVASVSSTAKDIPDWISPDGCRLYLHSDRDGSPHEYVSTRMP